MLIPPVQGATPEGAIGERQVARSVRDMFGRVAHRYDRANHLLSMNIDRHWRRRAVERVSGILHRPEARVLDVCCGTGDLTLALAAERGAPILASDFCHPMLTAAVPKFSTAGLRSPVFEADALSLPLASHSIDLLTCAFGFRNLASYDAGLREFRRVLAPNGKLAILEFSHPPNPAFAAAYRFYAGRILPRLGGLLSGVPGAYRYLPDSVRKFPSAEDLSTRIEAAGFRDVTFERLTFGIVALHLASPAASGKTESVANRAALLQQSQ